MPLNQLPLELPHAGHPFSSPQFLAARREVLVPAWPVTMLEVVRSERQVGKWLSARAAGKVLRSRSVPERFPRPRCASPHSHRYIVPRIRGDLKPAAASAGQHRQPSGRRAPRARVVREADPRQVGRVQAGLWPFRSPHSLMQGMGIASDLSE